ncbi:MAG: flagellar biosynthesis repressor FlbT [Ponticaulis sp.]|nr:flagellar biosynthesis repressor FlbT [Ponticaulis sp.]|tara:strand:+ start:898 stop:1335 length:438 start_codon:yes stop_codon:yes gene_type:complete
MPLKLSLKPGEKFVVNGAVIQNGDRRGVLLLQNKASVLREKDIMQPHEASTPARRIYFPVMMMYLDPSDVSEPYEDFVMRMTEFMSAIRNPEILKECISCSKDVMAGQYYKALSRCRTIMGYEEECLGYVDQGVSANSKADRESA